MGQRYVDGLIVPDPIGEQYQAALAQAEDFDGLRFAITETYRRSLPDRLAQRIAEALLLAELAGAYSVVLDNPGGGDSLLTLNSGWRIPRLFRAAAEWLSKRIERAASVPVVYEFAQQPNRRAPVVAAAAQLDTANRLRRRVDALEKRAATMPEAKSELDDLLRDLGCEPARAPQPVIQEEVQKRFARTRSEILSLDFYRAAYPFWRYVATLDERTTQGCRALDGLTMPASDPRWVGFVPPRHWRCRAHVVAVVHSVGAQARKTQPYEQYAGDGSFGTLIEEWEPKPGDYPQDLWEIYAAAKGITSPHVELEGTWWRKKS